MSRPVPTFRYLALRSNPAPAMAAGVSDTLLSVSDIVALIECEEAMEDGSLLVG